jgi:hypothetical protein
MFVAKKVWFIIKSFTVCIAKEGICRKTVRVPKGHSAGIVRKCEKYFRLDYRYNAYKKEVKEKIIEDSQQ